MTTNKLKNNTDDNEQSLSSDEKIKILIVDDDSQYQRFLGELLKEMGYSPQLVKTGWEGLKDCHEERPKLVLTDIFMPYMDGVKFIEMIRSADFYVPIIAMTGGDRTGHKDNHLQSAWLVGADATLPKPIDIDQLQLTIEKLLKTYNETKKANDKLSAQSEETAKDKE